jgi:hypothetical protein
MRSFRAVVLALVLLPTLARAQVVFYGPTTIIDGGTNNVAATATNTYALRIDVPRATDLALYLSAKPLTTNIVTLAFSLQRSLDGVTADSTLPGVITLTGTTNSASPTRVNLVTNIATGGIPYYFLTAVGNTEGVAATNLTVSYGFKRDR